MCNENGSSDRTALTKVLATLLAEPAGAAGEQAWTAFARLLRLRLFRIGAKMRLPRGTTEDMIQGVFVALLERWGELRTGRPEAVPVLAHKMMHDKAVDEIRRLGRRRAASLAASTSEPLDRGLSESAYRVEAAERHEWMAARLAELESEQPENCRLLREYFLRERSIEDLAAEAGCSMHAVECRISRALARLRRLADEHPPGGWARA